MAGKPTLTLEDFYGDQEKLNRAQEIYNKGWDATNPAGTTAVNTKQPTFGRDQFGSMGEWAEFNRAYENAWGRENPSDRGINTELVEGIATGKINPDQVPGNYNALAAQYLDMANGMGDFNYDFNNDPLFKTLAHSYMEQAKAAANDASALAAARTGGYGNSYGATAASQQYNATLDDLYDRVPELQEAAYNQYMNKKNDYYAQAGYYNDMANQADERNRAEYNRKLEVALTYAQLGEYSMLEDMFGVDLSVARNADLLNQISTIISAYGPENISMAGPLIQQVMNSYFAKNGNNGGGSEQPAGEQQAKPKTDYQPTESAGVITINGQQVLLPPSETYNGTYEYFLGNDGKTLMYRFTDGYGNVHTEPYKGILLAPDGTIVQQATPGAKVNYTPSYPESILQTKKTPANQGYTGATGRVYVDPAVMQAAAEATPVIDLNAGTITWDSGAIGGNDDVHHYGTQYDYGDLFGETGANGNDGGGSGGGNYVGGNSGGGNYGDGGSGGGYYGNSGGGEKTIQGNDAAPPAQSITPANTTPNIYKVDVDTWDKIRGKK